MGRLAWNPPHNHHLVHPLMARLVPLFLSKHFLGVLAPCFETSLRGWTAKSIMGWFINVGASHAVGMEASGIGVKAHLSEVKRGSPQHTLGAR
jgi:hypothetical protein